MHNTDDLDAWDNLDSEFGLDTDAKKAKPELHEQAPPPASKMIDDETPIAEEDEPELHSGALFDPGPEQILEDTDHINAGATDEEFDDTDASDLFDTEAAPVGEAAEGGEGGDGKRKRKRRRRKKKKGGDPNAAPGEAAVMSEGDTTEAVVPDDEAIVEEGEAPSEIVSEDDDEEGGQTSAVDEELVAAANQPKQEWNVMTWSDLIGKLHRPG